MKGLTKKQQAILDYIEEFMRREGMAPTVYELGDYFKIRSATAFAHLRALQRKGYVNRSSKARSLSLTGVPRPGTGPGGTLTIAVPVIGHVAAGMPLLAEERVERVLRFDPAQLPRGTGGHKLFALKIFGESMRDAGMLDGDTVVAKQAAEARNGDVVVALVDGTETTVKYLYHHGHQVELRPANPAYAPQFYPPEQVQLQGVVIALMRVY
ncbi:MAG: transcriptional repressor LexA [Lentisphaeria bacterium]|jgi:repressor LexA